MEKTTLVDTQELMKYASSIGFDINYVSNIFIMDRVIPMDEIQTITYYLKNLKKETFEYSDWSDDSIKILTSFMKENKLKKMTVL